MALLATYLTLAGNAFGPGPHVMVGNTPHPARLFVVLVGPTAAGRKGVSWGETAAVMDEFEGGWEDDYVFGGFGSGEGLIARIAERMDADEANMRVRRDPRLVVHEGEFASVLKVAARDSSILGTIMRDAWDGKRLQNNVKKARIIARSGHMVSLLAHITADELRRELTITDQANGFGNRFMFVGVRRLKRIAHPITLDAHQYGMALRDAVKASSGLSVVSFDDDAYDVWTQHYHEVENAAENAPGLVGSMIARGAAQMRRLSLTYALLDSDDHIRAHHIEAARAFWDYSANTVRRVFSDMTGNPISDKIAQGIDTALEGLTRTEISDLLSRNYSKVEIDIALAELLSTGAYEEVEISTGGRSAHAIRSTKEYERTKEGVAS